MTKEPWNWELDDLQILLGQAESLRIEFKRSDIINEARKFINEFSKEISAFANSEGGVIVVGVQEKKIGKSRIAEKLDQGIELAKWSPEQLQQIIESNISPPLNGIRINPIFTDINHAHYYLVIFVPKGTTAYQAKDCIYYGRSEYECKALRDHEIRLRMFRGKVPEATVILENKKVLKSNVPRNGKFLPGSRNYGFHLVLLNTGEINITQFKIQYYIATEDGEIMHNEDYPFRDDRVDPRTRTPFNRDERKVMNLSIYPGDKFQLSSFDRDFDSEKIFLDKKPIVHWFLYLQDRPKITGEISIQDEFRNVTLSEE